MRYFTIPSDLTTLAHARPGMALEVRHVLGSARRGGPPFEAGERVVCRHVNGQGLIVTTADGTAVNVPWEVARCLQVERVHGDGAGGGEPGSDASLRLLAAGPVTRLLARHGGRRARGLVSDRPTTVVRRTIAQAGDRARRMAGGLPFHPREPSDRRS